MPEEHDRYIRQATALPVRQFITAGSAPVALPWDGTDYVHIPATVDNGVQITASLAIGVFVGGFLAPLLPAMTGDRDQAR